MAISIPRFSQPVVTVILGCSQLVPKALSSLGTFLQPTAGNILINFDVTACHGLLMFHFSLSLASYVGARKRPNQLPSPTSVGLFPKPTDGTMY